MRAGTGMCLAVVCLLLVSGGCKSATGRGAPQEQPPPPNRPQVVLQGVQQPLQNSLRSYGNLYPARDPFQPLVAATEAAPNGAGPAAGPVGGPSRGSAVSGQPGQSGEAGPAGQAPRLLSLYRVDGVSRAGIEIGGKYYDAAAGEDAGGCEVQDVDMAGRRVTLVQNGQTLVLNEP